MSDDVNHPKHYGGADYVYECIKVIEAWGLGFALGNAVKYISRADKKGERLKDLQKARWYLDREIAREEERRRKLGSGAITLPSGIGSMTDYVERNKL